MPTQAPYRFIDRRQSAAGYQVNLLYDGGSQQPDRANIPFLDRDTGRNVSSLGRRTLMSLGRFLFANYPAIEGAVLEQAALSVASLVPVYEGENKKWGELAEAKLAELDNVLNVRGWPHDGKSFREMMIVAEIRDGDEGVILTETPDGYPQFQKIPAHRINSLPGIYTVTDDSPYNGLRIQDGVIMDDYGRAVAYRVMGENPYDYSTFVDISARNLALHFNPKFSDQFRGYSALASAVFDWQDLKESRSFELLAQKVCASKTILEWNETGEIDEAKQIVKARADLSTGSKTTLDVVSLNKGMYHYLKAGSGSKLTPFQYDRPGDNVQKYQERIKKDAFQGIEWSSFFSDPESIGGASMRVIIEKINNTIAKRQDGVIRMMKRCHGYAIAKFIKRGDLPEDKDWFRWGYRRPAQLSADKKYDSDVDINELRSGLTTRAEITGRNGLRAADVDEEKFLETDRLLGNAKKLADTYGLQIQECIVLLASPTPNGNLATVRLQEQGPDTQPPAQEKKDALP